VTPEPTPAPALLEPAVDPVAPRPVKEPARPTSSTDSRRKDLRGRLRKLEKRLQRAAARGEQTALFQQQVDALTSALKDATSSDKLEAIETALGRLEREIN
jgi:hypothetical protein